MKRLNRTVTWVMTLSGAFWCATTVNALAQRIYPLTPYVPQAVADTGDILALKPGNPWQTVVIRVLSNGAILETVLPNGGNGTSFDISEDGKVAAGMVLSPYRGPVAWVKDDFGRWYSTSVQNVGDVEHLSRGHYLVGTGIYTIQGNSLVRQENCPEVVGGWGDNGSAATLLKRLSDGRWQVALGGCNSALATYPSRNVRDIVGYTSGYVYSANYVGIYHATGSPPLTDVTIPDNGTITGYGGRSMGEYFYGQANNQAVRWRAGTTSLGNTEPLINLIGTAGINYPQGLTLRSVTAVSQNGRYIVGSHELNGQTGYYLIDMGVPPTCSSTLPGDVNGDGRVDDGDLSIVLFSFGRSW